MERFTISLEEELARQFDAWIRLRGYRNRSEAVRDLLRKELATVQLAEGGAAEGVGVITYIYDHHKRELARRLTHMQHSEHDLTRATLHIHLDHERCLETVILRGSVERIQAHAQAMTAEAGVRHGHLHVVPMASITDPESWTA
ncbi:MAG: nickel-responsive transcriptional regulator NikR [Magnetococcales bacterium]|nr:nickel-responsive transcriptional regulator NikR [Magnetococcales bacterium]MBF0321359.1 nickel-responsive transcriptional regulator NikR [Magnetococcales bacterium]